MRRNEVRELQIEDILNACSHYAVRFIKLFEILNEMKISFPDSNPVITGLNDRMVRITNKSTNDYRWINVTWSVSYIKANFIELLHTEDNYIEVATESEVEMLIQSGLDPFMFDFDFHKDKEIDSESIEPLEFEVLEVCEILRILNSEE